MRRYRSAKKINLLVASYLFLSAADAEKFTEALCRILEREQGWKAKSPE